MKEKARKSYDMERFLSRMKELRLKATPQRIAVHEAMMALGHACADTVREYIVSNTDYDITVASVYNILDSMSSLGIYKFRMSSNNKKYYDINTYNHVHLYDAHNHKFKDIADDELIRLVEEHFKGRKFRGYKIDTIDVQVVVHPTRKAAKTTKPLS